MNKWTFDKTYLFKILANLLNCRFAFLFNLFYRLFTKKMV